MTLRVCQVVATLDVGGIERWLLNVARHFAAHHAAEVQVDFLTLFGAGGALARELEAAGCGLQAVPFSWRRLSATRAALRDRFAAGGYDVVHCHADYLGGVVLPEARRAGVPLRINHIHNTRFAFDDRSRPLRWLAGRVLRRRSFASANLHVGCSGDALAAFTGSAGQALRTAVVYCGTPLQAYGEWTGVGRRDARAALGLPPDRAVVLHIGRHVAPKNPGFLLEAFAALLGRGVDAQLLMAGSGPLTPGLVATVAERGLLGRVQLLGDRDDVPRLLRAADLLALPSIHEGLPVAVVEAQAAGVRCLIADDVTAEVEIVPELVARAALSIGPAGWAGRIERDLARPVPDAVEALARVRQSPFDLETGSERLLDLYRRGVQAARAGSVH